MRKFEKGKRTLKKFAKVTKMTYLCTNKNLILLYGTKNKETKKDKIAPRRYRQLSYRSDSISSHCGYIVDSF